MIDIEDFNYSPTIDEISEFVRNPLFDDLCQKMMVTYKANCKIEFSKCSWAYGWNIKFKKYGKTLCTIYPKESYFTALVVIGKKEKEQAEEALLEMSPEIQEIYRRTQEGNGQRWLMIDLEDAGAVYNDALALIDIRAKCK